MTAVPRTTLQRRQTVRNHLVGGVHHLLQAGPILIYTGEHARHAGWIHPPPAHRRYPSRETPFHYADP